MRRAAGYILFHEAEDQRRYLLLRNARHGTWSFPKGHLDGAESLEDGARRELEEETGITDIVITPGFAHEMTYTVRAGDRPKAKKDYVKSVTLFLAGASSPDWTRSDEHDAGEWMTVEDVREHLQHQALREAFEAAVTFLARDV